MPSSGYSMAPKAAQQNTIEVERIKQYPGQVQVTRAVKVNVPGKHFPQLQPAEQKQMYTGTAVEYAERHRFDRHLKAWGAPGTHPGIRIDSSATRTRWTTRTARASGLLSSYGIAGGTRPTRTTASQRSNGLQRYTFALALP